METLERTRKGFSFDVEEAFKSGFYLSGAPGSGKSDVAMYAIDELLKTGAIVYVLDPSQDWIERFSSIKYIVTFKNPPYTLEEIQLKSGILDTSTLTVLQIQEVVDRFCWLLYKHQADIPKEKRRQIFLLFEEAQMAFPQGVMRAKRLQNVVRLITVGRNYKLRCGLVTQFASTVDKDVLKSCRQRYFGWTDEKNDCAYIGSIIGMEEANTLRYQKPGEFLYNYPAKNIQEKIKIQPYH